MVLWPSLIHAQKTDSLFQVIQELDSDEEKVILLDTLISQIMADRAPGSDSIFTFRLALAKRSHDVESEVRTARQFAHYCYMQYRDDEARKIINPYLNRTNELSDSLEKALTLYRFANILMVFKENREAIEFLEHASQIYEQQNDTLNSVYLSSLADLGALYLTVGQIGESAVVLNQARDQYRFLKDTLGMFDAITNLFILYSQIGLYEEATVYAEQGRALFGQDPGDVRLIAWNINVARNYLQQQEWNKAIRLYKAQIPYIDSIDENVHSKIYLYNGLIEGLYFGNQRDSIPYYFQRLEEEFRGLNNTQEFYFLYQQSRFLYRMSRGQYTLAEEDGLELLNNSIDGNDAAEIMLHNQFLAELYRVTGNYQQALTYTEAYLEVHDSILAANKAAALLLYQTQYETKEKESQIVRLNQNAEILSVNLERNRLYKFLLMAGVGLLLLIGIVIYNRIKYRQLLKIQDLRMNISSDLHDEVGSLLSGIYMQTDMLPAVPDKEKPSLISEIGDNIKKAVTMMGDLVWSIDSRRDSLLDLKDKITDTCHQWLNQASFRYKIELNAPDQGLTELSPAVKKEIYLVCKEAINNVIKHSNGDLVEIKLTHLDNKLSLMVRDNGTKSLNASLSGQGLQNMERRAQTVGGKLTIKKGADYFQVIMEVPV